MKIVIAGAGAMGSRFAIMLKRGGNDVTLIDGWPAHIEAIREHGLRANLNGEEIAVPFSIYSQNEIPTTVQADLILVFTKAMQLDQMMQTIKPMIGEQTKVLCLLNGIGHEDTIEKYVSTDKIFLGNTIWTADLIGPGNVRLFGDGSVELQNIEPGKEEDARQLAAVLADAGLNASYSENIRYSIYRKACVNGTLNGLCSILNVNIAQFGQTSTARAMVQTIVEEFAAVAAHESVELDVSEVVHHIEETYDPEGIGMHYPSMYQDLINNHRKTEIDYINGAISRKGRKYQVSTPYCDFLTQMIHAKEDILAAE